MEASQSDELNPLVPPSGRLQCNIRMPHRVPVQFMICEASLCWDINAPTLPPFSSFTVCTPQTKSNPGFHLHMGTKISYEVIFKPWDWMLMSSYAIFISNLHAYIPILITNCFTPLHKSTALPLVPNKEVHPG